MQSTEPEIIDAEIETPQALAVRGSFLPAMTLEVATERYGAFRAFVQAAMTEGVDYGTIPGTGKPTLFKPGAEKICTLFGLSQRMEMADKLEDWDKGLVFYRYRCALWRGDVLVAEAEGSCNSREKKYTRRDVFDVANTVLKMAQKRALVAAALLAGNASEFFTQDLEDAPAPERPKAATEEQLVEIERLGALVPIGAEEAAMKAFGLPLAEMQQGQGQRLIGLLKAKLKQQQRESVQADREVDQIYEDTVRTPERDDERRAKELRLKDLAVKADVALKTALSHAQKEHVSDLTPDELDAWIRKMERRIAEREKRPLPEAAPQPERVGKEDVRVLNALWDDCRLSDLVFEEFEKRFGAPSFDALDKADVPAALEWIRDQKAHKKGKG